MVLPSLLPSDPRVLPNAGMGTGRQRDLNVLRSLRHNLGIFNAEQEKLWNEAVTQFLSQDISFTSESLRRRRERVRDLWSAVLKIFDAAFNLDEEYNVDTIKKHAERFLPAVLHNVKPVNGSSKPSATTFRQYFEAFVWLIMAFCIDTNQTTGEIVKCGQKLLRDGLFTKLEDQFKFLSLSHGLIRHPGQKGRYGRRELHLIICRMLEASSELGKAPQRAVVIQRVVQYLLVFYTTCRPSTLGPSEEIWRNLGQFIKMEDVTVLRHKRMQYTIVLTFKHFKGRYSTTEGSKQQFHLTTVTKNHNTVFDITLWFLALFFVRSDFEKEYKTLDDLLDDESLVIRLDPKKAHYPLFREAASGGRGFAGGDPPDACTAHSVAESFRYNAKAAGFKNKMGIYNLRRDSGDAYAGQMGEEAGKDVMCHTRGRSVLRAHYMQSISAKVNLVGVRLGEVKGSEESVAGEYLQAQDDNLSIFMSAALQVLTRKRVSSAIDSSDSLPNNTTKPPKGHKRQRNEHDENIEVVEIDIKIARKWWPYLACFEWKVSKRKELQMTRQNVRSLHDGRYKTTMSRKPGKDAEIEARYKELDKLYGERFSAKQKISKNAKRRRMGPATSQVDAEWTEHDEALARSDLARAMRTIDAAAMDLHRAQQPTIDEDEAPMDDGSSQVPVRIESGPSTEGEASVLLEDPISNENGPSVEASAPKESALERLLDMEWVGASSQASSSVEEPPKLWIDAVRDVNAAIAAEEEMERVEAPRVFKLLKEKKTQPSSTDNATAEEAPDNAAAEETQVDLDSDLFEQGCASLEEDLRNMADTEEDREFDVFGALSLEEVKMAMLNFFLGPCLADDRTPVPIDDGKMVCKVCDDRGVTFCGNYSQSKRHNDYHHSEWKELEYSLKNAGGNTFHCPSCPDYVFDSCEELMYEHMLSAEDCQNQAKYSALLATHRNALSKWRPKTRANPTEPAGLKNRAEDAMMEKLVSSLVSWSITPRPEHIAVPEKVRAESSVVASDDVDFHGALDGFSFPRLTFDTLREGRFTDEDCQHVYAPEGFDF